MNIIVMILIFLVVLIIACLTAWHYGEHHQLHKVQNEFDSVLERLGPSSRFRQGLQLAKQIVKTMDENFRGNYVEKPHSTD